MVKRLTGANLAGFVKSPRRTQQMGSGKCTGFAPEITGQVLNPALYWHPFGDQCVAINGQHAMCNQVLTQFITDDDARLDAIDTDWTAKTISPR